MSRRSMASRAISCASQTAYSSAVRSASVDVRHSPQHVAVRHRTRQRRCWCCRHRWRAAWQALAIRPRRPAKRRRRAIAGDGRPAASSSAPFGVEADEDAADRLRVAGGPRSARREPRRASQAARTGAKPCCATSVPADGMPARTAPARRRRLAPAPLGVQRGRRCTITASRRRMGATLTPMPTTRPSRQLAVRSDLRLQQDARRPCGRRPARRSAICSATRRGCGRQRPCDRLGQRHGGSEGELQRLARRAAGAQQQREVEIAGRRDPGAAAPPRPAVCSRAQTSVPSRPEGASRFASSLVEPTEGQADSLEERQTQPC